MGELHEVQKTIRLFLPYSSLVEGAMDRTSISCKPARVRNSRRFWLAIILLCATSLLLSACSVRREPDNVAQSNPAQLLETKTPQGDAGLATSGHLSVLLRLNGATISVEKIERIEIPLRKPRGARQRRGLLLLGKDGRNQRVHWEVVADPRREVAEVADDAGVLHAVAPATAVPAFLLVRVPLTARQLFVYDAGEGELDSDSVEEQPAFDRRADAAATAHPLIATLTLEAR
jgi:hypothetical protein